MCKYCLACGVEIPNKSKQWINQKYCTSKCKKVAHRKKNSQKTRIEQKRANLIQNDEVIYLLRQCKRAGTVEILKGHDLNSFLETMSLVRDRPKGDVKLCHIAPVKGGNSTGLFHCKNLFYGGSHQNRKFGSRYFSGGLSICNKELKKEWRITDDMLNNQILIMVEEYLGDIIPRYLEVSPVRKSKKVQIADKIIALDESKNFDDLMLFGYKALTEEWSKISRIQPHIVNDSNESKYITYMMSLSRFINYGGEMVSTLIELREIMIIGYMALERVKRSETYNKYFYVHYELLINEEYGQAMLKNSDKWSVFKDLIYKTAFEVLQGRQLDIKRFRRAIMSYLTFPDKAWQDKKIS